MGHYLAVFSVAVLTSCQFAEYPKSVSGCADACSSWRRNGCEEGEPSPVKKVTCEDACEAAIEFDSEMGPILDCISKANSCEKARECE